MEIKELYKRAKARILANEEICSQNRALFEKFFAFEEYKLRRQNDLPAAQH